MPGAAAMPCTTAPAMGARTGGRSSTASSIATTCGGSGSTSSPSPSSTAASNAGKASAAILGSTINSRTWPRRAPSPSSLLKLFADTALLSLSLMRRRISPSNCLANCARIFAGRACKPWALARPIRALGQSAGTSPPSTSNTVRLLVARHSSCPRPSISSAQRRSSKA
ncbi:hypothetical protein D3C80_1049450 [compost metagenome]